MSCYYANITIVSRIGCLLYVLESFMIPQRHECKTLLARLNSIVLESAPWLYVSLSNHSEFSNTITLFASPYLQDFILPNHLLILKSEFL